MDLFQNLKEHLGYLSKSHVELIYQAYLCADAAHEKQFRRSGEPYIIHPVAVATILAKMRVDHHCVMAGLLHDTIEDTSLTKEDIKDQFGEVVADLVDGMSKLARMEFKSRIDAQAASFRKMLLAMSKDIRVIIVKLADRLHNMRTLMPLEPQKRRNMARETLEIYAPIAKRLGMHDFVVELEDLGLHGLYPRRYEVLSHELLKVQGRQKGLINEIKARLSQALIAKEVDVLTISGRKKNIYSIYRKMRDKHLSFSEISDFYALRIIVSNVDDCYRSLGVVHGLFKPVPEKFKDYIALPKANGYQSLHTVLFGPYGLPIEMQIRTHDMENRANSGIAAHWLYKQHEEHINISELRAQSWIQRLIDMQKRTGNSEEFLENVKIDLVPGETYVFTPGGEIMELPIGATALDFAYAVHTEVGNQCVAVKIDRQLVPLSTVLNSGATVEVITSPSAHPSPSWLDIVITPRAKSCIRHYIKNQQVESAVMLGRKLLDSALVPKGLSLDGLTQTDMARVATLCGAVDFDQVLGEVGLGHRAAQLVVAHIVQEYPNPKEQRSQEPLLIQGTEGMVVTFSDCCCPIPGDPIVAYLSPGRGIQVHHQRCGVLIKKQKYHVHHCVPVCWSEKIEGSFKARVRLQSADKPGILALLSRVVSDANANIEQAIMKEAVGGHHRIDMLISVSDRVHLADVFRCLRRLKFMQRVWRRLSP